MSRGGFRELNSFNFHSKAWVNTFLAKPYVPAAHFTKHLTSVQGPDRKMLGWKAHPHFPAVSVGLMRNVAVFYRPEPLVAPVPHSRRKGTAEDI